MLRERLLHIWQEEQHNYNKCLPEDLTFCAENPIGSLAQ